MERAGIPTAGFFSTEDPAEAEAALDQFSYPVVLKADGLAAGKGVVICATRAEAVSTIHAMFSGALVGAAGRRLVIEEFLTGEEVSFIGLSDGERIVALEPSQDHKTIFDGDQGPNTGGMGAYSDSRILSADLRELVQQSVMQRTVDQMSTEGTPFSGFLYAGLMMTAAGPKVLEFNVRLGDPETQALLHRLRQRLRRSARLPPPRANARADLLSFSPDPSVCVVLAAHGYPGTVRTGDPITGISQAEATGAVVFQAGTRFNDQNELVTSGGRVLGVTASGSTLPAAIDAAYAACSHIHFDGMPDPHRHREEGP